MGHRISPVQPLETTMSLGEGNREQIIWLEAHQIHWCLHRSYEATNSRDKFGLDIEDILQFMLQPCLLHSKSQ